MTGPRQHFSQIRSYGHGLNRWHSRSTDVPHWIATGYRRWTSDEQPNELTAHFPDVSRSPSGTKHGGVHTNVRPCPRLTENVCVLQKLPASRPFPSSPQDLGFDKIRVDSVTDFLGHAAHDVIRFAKARQRRCRIR